MYTDFGQILFKGCKYNQIHLKSVDKSQKKGQLMLSLFKYSLIYHINPSALALFIASDKPILLITFIPFGVTRSSTQRFSSANQNRLYCRFGKNFLRVLIFEWETWFPVIVFFPVIWQTRAITIEFLWIKGCKYSAFFNNCKFFNKKGA